LNVKGFVGIATGDGRRRHFEFLLKNGWIVLLEKEKATPFESGPFLFHTNYQDNNGEVAV